MAGLQGRIFGGYQLDEQLPSGGIAEVYRAHPTMAGGREVVVKVIHPEFAHQPGFLPNFRRIVQLSSRLATHPHIMPLVTSGEENGSLYLVTPYVAAGTLKGWLAQGGRLGAADAGPFFHQLCDALTHAHSLGVTHGNIKPSNIFLFEGRHVLLGDFGMLWDVTHMDMNHAGSGTDAVDYLAPEVATGQVTQHGDVYSVGALLFTTLTGRPPFRGSTPAEVFAAHTRQPIPTLAQADATLTPALRALDSVIQRALAKRPEDRFPSAAAVAQAIETILRQTASTTLAPSAPAGPFMPVPPTQPFWRGAGPSMPQSGPVFPFPTAPVTAPAGWLGEPAASGLDGSAFQIPGLSTGTNGIAFGGSAILQPLDPPFPPLSAGEHIDGQMEQGRLGSAQFSGDIAFGMMPPHAVPATGPVADLENESTMRVPAPHAAPGALASGNIGAPSGEAEAGSGTPQARVPRSFAPPRGGFAQRLGAAKVALDDDAGAQIMPAIHPNSAVASPGFAVTGRSDLPDMAAAAEPGPDGDTPDVAAPRSFFVSGGPAGQKASAWSVAPSDVGLADVELPGSTSGSREDASEVDLGAGGAPDGFPLWHVNGHGEAQRHNGDPAMPGEKRDDRPFSATQLGLPRLTDLDLSHLPSNWEENLGGRDRAPVGANSAELQVEDLPPISSSGWSPSGESSWQESASLAAARRPGQDEHGDQRWNGDAMSGWEAHRPGPTWQESAVLSASIPALSGALPERGRSGKRRTGRGSRNRRDQDDLANEGFVDTGSVEASGWTAGLRRLRGGRHRSFRKVALFAALVLLFDLCALTLARPELCPTTGCLMLDRKVHELAPSLYTNDALIPITSQPRTVTMHVPSGGTNSVTITVKNTSDTPVTWQASASLPWLTVSGVKGPLVAGDKVSLTITAKPVSVKAGTYSADIALAVGLDTLHIPTTIVVEAGGQLATTPQSLTFAQCATTQRLTLKNIGTASLSFNVVPSQTVLTLSISSGTLPAGGSRTIGVTLSCAAAPGSTYTVNIASSTGSVAVPVQYAG